ncbi:chorismate mutase [Streptomyces alkaliphilus]|uniref:Chorismate mutase n=1 Tax=Streptomyces alkaliphilus TaxID=1472722 RepID=A0A7W3TI08_9ACTN|nr:chorismate mutase [Streptomyces alkaliphilus]MQS07980.1 chorismate mutase [Streptomyces alkaliphilus]
MRGHPVPRPAPATYSHGVSHSETEHPDHPDTVVGAAGEAVPTVAPSPSGGSAGSGAVTDPAIRAELTRLRESIDNIDAAVVHMLAERFKCTQQVGRLKAEHRLPPADPEREARQIARLRSLAENARLDPAFAEKLLNFIIAEVIRHHETIAGTGESGG